MVSSSLCTEFMESDFHIGMQIIFTMVDLHYGWTWLTMTIVDCGWPWLTMINHVYQFLFIGDHGWPWPWLTKTTDDIHIMTFGIVCHIMIIWYLCNIAMRKLCWWHWDDKDMFIILWKYGYFHRIVREGLSFSCCDDMIFT